VLPPSAPLPPRHARKKPNLRDRLRHAVRACRYSRRTEKPYVHWIKSYIFFHDTHEDRGGETMHWIVTLIVGAVVGWLASILMKTNAQMGAIANIVVGIIGSSLGFWLAGVLGLSTGGPIVGWVVAVVGAALLIFILKAVGIFA
jgi:uncharacterized membrane protein YeaQ/YmgE (transglycosylase-associated protein family)